MKRLTRLLVGLLGLMLLTSSWVFSTSLFWSIPALSPLYSYLEIIATSSGWIVAIPTFVVGFAILLYAMLPVLRKRGLWKQLCLLAVSGIVAATLLALTSYDRGQFFADFASFGYPLAWHYYIPAFPPIGISFFGVFLGGIVWVNLVTDLLFYSALSLALVESSFNFAIPLVIRKLKIHHRKQSAIPASAANVIQVDQVPLR